MEARLTVDDLDLGDAPDPGDDGERQGPQRPPEATEPRGRPDRWAWLWIAPDGALHIESEAA
jgi:hypothetical protein